MYLSFPSIRRVLTGIAVMSMAATSVAYSQEPAAQPQEPAVTAPVHQGRKPAGRVAERKSAIRIEADDLAADSISPGDTITSQAIELLLTPDAPLDPWAENEGKFSFNPDPIRAVWMSVLFPGLGQIYNRRWWKLPIIVGGFMGLGYGVSWNNMMLGDYTRAYADLLDNDPSTKSYMEFFPPTVQESQLDKTWLTNLLRSRRNFFRRNRDLCIISMVGVYLLAIVDAYVDASLAHFDITPDISMDVYPAMIPDTRVARPGFGLLWAVNF